MKTKINFLFSSQGMLVSQLQVRINKIDDFGAKTAYKTMIFQSIQYKLVYLLDHYLGFPK